MRQSPSLIATFAVAVLLTAARPASATEYVLTIGGGHSAHNNQVSLEKNVQYFCRVLDELLPAAKHTILFADGDDPRRDLQFIDPDAESSRVELLLARVLDQNDHLAERYRDHELPKIDGSASRENIAHWFDDTANALKPSDRVIIYATAHGGRSDDRQQPRNSTLYLWNDEISVDWLCKELDKFPKEVPVVVVMVQCYSGGFADLIFDEADRNDRPTAHDRAGFFATSHTRVAAGCTPDIDEADYHEYSSSFWAAILGTTRTGETVASADYDADGTISFAEAHAFVLLDSDTIDIPVKTSDTLLRTISSENRRATPVIASRDDKKERSSESSDEGPKRVTALRPVAPLTARSPIAELLGAANPVEKRVITGLSEQLKLAADDRTSEARNSAEKIENQRKQLRSRIRRLERDHRNARQEIESELLAEWPELSGTWNHEARRLVVEQPAELIRLIESHEEFETFDRLEGEILDLENERLDLERRWVKCQRLIQTLETVALAHNLAHSADSDLLDRYEKLRAAENATLAPTEPVP